MGRLLSASAAARHLGVGTDTFWRWKRAGILPEKRDPLTGRVRYSDLALDEWSKINDAEREAS